VARDTWWNLSPDKRERVLTAALREFGRRGFSAGSLNAVAREAGIAKGSLFQYFEDKLDLYATICQQVCEEARAVILKGVDPAGDRPFFDVIRDLTANWLRYFRAHPLARDIGLAIKHDMDPAARAAVSSTVNAYYVDTLSPLAKQAADRGELGAEVDPDQLVAMLIMVLRFLDAAPFYPHMDPVLGLYGKKPDEVDAVAMDLIAAVERAYAHPPRRRKKTHDRH
jgi:AcrR family transcriptional regulator